MKKILIVLATLMLSTTVVACPKGQHLHGGTGPHHKGGYCSAKK